MESFYVMLRIQSVLLIYMLVGVYIRKRNIIPANVCPYFTELLVKITMPCMIFNSFNRNFGLDELKTASEVMLASFAVCVCSQILGGLLYRRMDFERRAIMRYGTMVSNATYAGFPQLQEAYGSIGLFYGSIFVIPLRIFVWSAGISLFVQADWKTKAKNILLNPCLIAVFLGMPRMLLHIPMPMPIDTAVAVIGECNTPLSMIVIGMLLADIPLRTALDKAALVLSAVRLILLPCGLLLVMRLLHADPMLTGVSVLLTAMPVGVTAPVLAQKYGADHIFASKCVLMSTLLSLVTIPLISIFL